MASIEISGSVMVRPLRLGLMVAPDLSQVTAAIQGATATWGGQYIPILDPADSDRALALSRRLDIDALYPLDTSEAANQLCETPGFRWRARSQSGPFDESDGVMPSQLMTVESLVESLSETMLPALYAWADDDPLRHLFRAWMGEYSTSGAGARIRSQLEARSQVTEIEPGAVVGLPATRTPIFVGTEHIEYTGQSSLRGFVAVDPDDPADIIRFWNARAVGGTVFPWPTKDSERLRDAAKAWIEHLRTAGELERHRYADGTPVPPQASVLLRPGADAVPDDLAEVLAAAHVTPLMETEVEAFGWTGLHPMRTECTRSFSVSVSDRDWQPPIALPGLPFPPARIGATRGMLIAAQISVYSELDPTNMRWATTPNLRRLAEIEPLPLSLEALHRPAYRGQVVAVQADALDCLLRLVQSHRVVDRLFAASRWSFEQSDNGIFATRLGAMLGGAPAWAPSEPAARQVLTKAVRSRRGKTLKELVDIARASRGTWPGPFARDDDVRRYPNAVVSRLLRDKILRPELSLRCPECTVLMSIRPEDLRTEITCQMCAATYPLGLALSISKTQHTWRYRTAPDVAPNELLEAVATLATRSALTRWRRLGGATAHMLGVKLTDRSRQADDDQSCEIDIMFMLDLGGSPGIIIGEVKHGGPVEPDDLRNDLVNLGAVQTWFRSQDIECWVMFATLRDSLEQAEIDVFRAACENSGRRLGTAVEPLFPIVLLGPELSASPMDDGSLEGAASKGGLAFAAAQRNLGLSGVTWNPGRNPEWTCTWAT